MAVWSNNDFFLEGSPQIVRDAAARLASTDLFPDDEPQVGKEIDLGNGDIRIEVLTSGYGWPDLEDDLCDLSRRGLRAFWHRSTSDSDMSCRLFEYQGGKAKVIFQQYDFLVIEQALDAIAARDGDADAIRRLATELEARPEVVQDDIEMCLEDTSMRIGVARILGGLLDEGFTVLFDPAKAETVISNLDALLAIEDERLVDSEAEHALMALRPIASKLAVGSVIQAGTGKMRDAGL